LKRDCSSRDMRRTSKCNTWEAKDSDANNEGERCDDDDDDDDEQEKRTLHATKKRSRPGQNGIQMQALVRRTIGQGRTRSKIQKPKFQKPKMICPHRAGFKIQFY